MLGGATAILLALVGAAYWAFQTFADKWLQSKFDERLEELRHEQTRELEHLRFSISTMMDRTTKLHEREYQTLPQLWEQLSEAWGEVASFISSVQALPDLSRMNDAELEEHLGRSPLFESQKQKVRDSKNRTSAYADEVYWHRKLQVDSAVRTFSRALRFNGIFVLPEIKEKMAKLDKLLWDAFDEFEFNQEHKPVPRDRKAKDLFENVGSAELKSLEKDIQERLWSVRRVD
ncbi:hypothetical protein [Devosia sp. Leaf64]|uniref:hypothetical protein n=1 Tax=Devosia sp. Leaf64 TaxID=1736229 RepID=UPI0007885570|nr:hypothetical protein [Devosia sp. Leaf64]